MLQLYSKGCEYMVRCLSEINQSELGKGFSVETVCKRADTPKWFSRKIFQSLAKKGFLVTKRGPGGGYRFRIHPSKISVLSIIEAVDGKNAFSKCIMRSSKCRGGHSCSLHPIWNDLKTTLMNELRINTIDQLMKKSNPKRRTRRI